MAGVIGQFLPEGTYYSPWFPANGNGAEMTLDLLGIAAGGGDILVSVEAKNSENPDDQIQNAWPDPNGPHAGVGQYSWQAGSVVGSVSPGFNELVRFKYVVNGLGVHFRMLNPSWYSG